MFRQYLAIVIISSILGSGVLAQNDDSSVALVLALETMESIEESIISSAEDMNAVSLILQDRAASRNANLFLVSLPGYGEAVSSKTLLDFKKQARKDYKDYKKLDNEARKSSEEKEDYLASISDQYNSALEQYREAL